MDWNDPNRLEVVTIFGTGHLVKGIIKMCKITFNRTGSRDLCNCPGGMSVKFFTRYADRDSPNPDKDKEPHARIAMYKQKHWSQ